MTKFERTILKSLPVTFFARISKQVFFHGNIEYANFKNVGFPKNSLVILINLPHLSRLNAVNFSTMSL